MAAALMIPVHTKTVVTSGKSCGRHTSVCANIFPRTLRPVHSSVTSPPTPSPAPKDGSDTATCVLGSTPHPQECPLDFRVARRSPPSPPPPAICRIQARGNPWFPFTCCKPGLFAGSVFASQQQCIAKAHPLAPQTY